VITQVCSLVRSFVRYSHLISRKQEAHTDVHHLYKMSLLRSKSKFKVICFVCDPSALHGVLLIN